MQIDMAPILSRVKKQIDFNFPFQVKYELFSVPRALDFTVTGMVKDFAGYMSLTAVAKAEYTLPCDRCLKPVNEKIEIGFERTVADNLTKPSEYGDDYIIISQQKIDFGNAFGFPIINAVSGGGELLGKIVFGQCAARFAAEV